MPLVRKRALEEGNIRDAPACKRLKSGRKELLEFANIGYTQDFFHSLHRSLPDDLDPLHKLLAKEIGSFLNGKGGILCFGCRPNGTIYGDPLPRKEEDNVKLIIDEVFKKFKPMVQPSRYRVTCTHLGGRYAGTDLRVVVEIRIQTGDDYEMYEDYNHEAYLRKKTGPYGPLTPHEIKRHTTQQLREKFKALRPIQSTLFSPVHNTPPIPPPAAAVSTRTQYGGQNNPTSHCGGLKNHSTHSGGSEGHATHSVAWKNTTTHSNSQNKPATHCAGLKNPATRLKTPPTNSGGSNNAVIPEKTKFRIKLKRRKVSSGSEEDPMVVAVVKPFSTHQQGPRGEVGAGEGVKRVSGEGVRREGEGEKIDLTSPPQSVKQEGVEEGEIVEDCREAVTSSNEKTTSSATSSWSSRGGSGAPSISRAVPAKPPSATHPLARSVKSAAPIPAKKKGVPASNVSASVMTSSSNVKAAAMTSSSNVKATAMTLFRSQRSNVKPIAATSAATSSNVKC